MKLKLFSIIAILFSLGFFSCKKTTKVAFTHATAKPWFDTHCASCHGSGKSNANSWLYDPNDFDGSIKSDINKIHNLVAVTKTMPPSGVTNTELQIFIDWYNAGFPAN